MSKRRKRVPVNNEASMATDVNDVDTGGFEKNPADEPLTTNYTDGGQTPSKPVKARRDVEYLVTGIDGEGTTVILCSFNTMHQLRKYFFPMRGAFVHSYRNIRFLKAKPATIE